MKIIKVKWEVEKWCIFQKISLNWLKCEASLGTRLGLWGTVGTSRRSRREEVRKHLCEDDWNGKQFKKKSRTQRNENVQVVVNKTAVILNVTSNYVHKCVVFVFLLRLLYPLLSKTTISVQNWFQYESMVVVLERLFRWRDYIMRQWETRSVYDIEMGNKIYMCTYKDFNGGYMCVLIVRVQNCE